MAMEISLIDIKKYEMHPVLHFFGTTCLLILTLGIVEKPCKSCRNHGKIMEFRLCRNLV